MRIINPSKKELSNLSTKVPDVYDGGEPPFGEWMGIQVMESHQIGVPATGFRSSSEEGNLYHLWRKEAAGSSVEVCTSSSQAACSTPPPVLADFHWFLLWVTLYGPKLESGDGLWCLIRLEDSVGIISELGLKEQSNCVQLLGFGILSGLGG